MRLEGFRRSFEKADIDTFLITREPNIFYLTGCTSGGVLIISHNGGSILLTSELNLTMAQDQAKDVEVRPYTNQYLHKQIAEICNGLNPRNISFDQLSNEAYNKIKMNLNCSEIKAKPNQIWEMRKIKDPEEKEMMKKAAKLTDIGMEAVRQFIKEGVREHEVAAEASYAMRKRGAQDISFPFIVASGQNSAYPHAGVTNRKIKKGDFVTVDMGAKYNGYCMDLTRTFIIGTPSKKQRIMYETVREAYEKAFPEYKEGARGVQVDKFARNVIEEKGFGEYFIHNLGHGVGIEVHEPPSLSKTSDDILKAGNTVTNEPGVYIPKYGGVRIEDTVLISSSRPTSLTQFDRDMDSMRI